MGKSLSQIDNVQLKLEKPMKLNSENMEYKKLMVLIGPNGSGKSLILKLTWVISYIMHLDINAKKLGYTAFNAKTTAQWVFDNSFDNNDFTGEIVFNFKNSSIELGSTFKIILNEGKVEELEILLEEDVTEAGMPRFMSTNIRLFSNMKIYFKMRKAEGNVFNDDFLGKALEYYKLYDILMMELLIARHSSLNMEEVNKHLKNYDFKEEYKEFTFDENACDFYLLDINDNKRYMSTYSNGEQSLVNMMIMNLV